MTDSVGITITLNGDVDLSALFLMSAESWGSQVKELRDLAAQHGHAVTYDLSMFDIEWSPQFGPDSDDPVSWVNASGTVIEGSAYPLQTAPNQ